MGVRGWLLGAAAALALVPALPAQSTRAKDLAVGKVLVASRDLGDPNFAGSVVLLLQYEEDNVLGVIVNRRSRTSMSDLFVWKEARTRSDLVYGGGPVERRTVLALLRSPSKPAGAKPVFGDVYLIAEPKTLVKTIPGVQADALRVYLGYAGWTGPQLRHEVEIGAWYIFPATAGFVFDSDPRSLWKRLIEKADTDVAIDREDRRPSFVVSRP